MNTYITILEFYLRSITIYSLIFSPILCSSENCANHRKSSRIFSNANINQIASSNKCCKLIENVTLCQIYTRYTRMMLKHFVINTYAYFFVQNSTKISTLCRGQSKINLARIKYLFERLLFFINIYVCGNAIVPYTYPLAKPAHLPAELPNAGE